MKLRSEDGAALIEFALVLPILLLLVFGIVDFGIALWNREVVTTASREGARFGIIIGDPRPTAAEIKDVVITALTNAGLNACDASCVTLDPPTGAEGGKSGDPLTVRVDYPLSFLVIADFIQGFYKKTFNKDITLSAQTFMKLE